MCSMFISLENTVPASNFIHNLFFFYFSHTLSYFAGFSVLQEESCSPQTLLSKDCLEFHLS